MEDTARRNQGSGGAARGRRAGRWIGPAASVGLLVCAGCDGSSTFLGESDGDGGAAMDTEVDGSQIDGEEVREWWEAEPDRSELDADSEAGEDGASTGRCGPHYGTECPSGTVCDIDTCEEGAGTCLLDPGACPGTYSPECGCDDVTYANECERRRAGMGLAHLGECGSTAACGGIAGTTCVSAGEVCDVRSCADDATGTCVSRPVTCSAVYEPVCGCDGSTYGNDCLRLRAGGALDHDGPCGSSASCGGSGGVPCASTAEVCDVRSCGPAVTGSCVARPVTCPGEYQPVCACDSYTYGNDCMRIVSEQALDYEGACGPVCRLTGETPPSGGCEGDRVCNVHGCTEGTTGRCVDRPPTCPGEYEPVCACNGVTYGNDCLRQIARQALAHVGACG